MLNCCLYLHCKCCKNIAVIYLLKYKRPSFHSTLYCSLYLHCKYCKHYSVLPVKIQTNCFITVLSFVTRDYSTLTVKYYSSCCCKNTFIFNSVYGQRNLQRCDRTRYQSKLARIFRCSLQCQININLVFSLLCLSDFERKVL